MKILVGPIRLFPPNEPKYDIAVDLFKRRFLTTGTRAVLGAMVLSGAGLSVACGEKISFYVSTVIGSLEALIPLLPNAAPQIRKAVEAAKAFDAAYRAGKFTDASTLFANLGDLALEIFNVVGVVDPRIGLAIALGRVAFNAIATLLKKQMEDQAVAAIVNAQNDPRSLRAKAMIERMADPKMIEAILADVK